MASSWREELLEIDGFDPVVIGAPIERRRPARRRQADLRRQHRHRHRPRRPLAAARRNHRPGRRHRSGRPELSQQLPGSRGVSAGRRPARPAVCAAHRRHLLHQSLVRHGGDDPQDGGAHRLRRRGRQLLRPQGSGRFRHGLPARRARGRTASAACGNGRSARASTPSTPTPAASCWCRPRTSCCTGSPARPNRTATTKACGRSTWSPKTPTSRCCRCRWSCTSTTSRRPSVIQRFGDVKKLITQTLDPMLSAYFRDVAHQKTMLELLHERDAIQGEARGRTAPQVPRLRHRVRRRAHRQAGHGRGGGGKIEVLLEQLRQRQLSHRAARNLRSADGRGRKAADAQRSAGPGQRCKRN